MRALSVALVVAVCLTAGVCATHSLQEAAEHLATAHKDLLQIFHTANILQARSLDIAQKMPTGTPPAICVTPQFLAIGGALNGVCRGEVIAASAAATDDARKTAATEFCTSGPTKCMGLIRATVIGTPYEQCLPPGSEAGQALAEFKAACQPSPSGANCFEYSLKLEAMKRACGAAYTNATCTATPNCAWERSGGGGENNGKCTVATTAATIGMLCSDCLDQFIRATGKAAFVELKNVVCSKVGNTYCAVAFAAARQAQQTPALMDEMCSATTKPCTVKVLQGMAANARATLASSHAQCLKSSDASASRCAENLRSSIWNAVSTDNTARTICSKTGSGAYCRLAVDNVATVLLNCTQRNPNNCNNACRTLIGAAVDAAGCCLGTFDEPPVVKAADLPAGVTLPSQVPGETPALPTGVTAGAKGTLPPGEETEDRVNTSPGNIESSIAALCPIPDLRARFAKRCAVKRVKEAKKALKVPLRWSKVNADPAIKARLEESFAGDVALNAGIARSDVLSVVFKEDASQKLKAPFPVASPSARRLQVSQTAEDSGVTADVTIATSSDADQANAIKTLDAAIASNTATFTATGSTAETECPDCLGTDGVAAISNSGKLNSPSTAGTRVTVLSAVVVAVIAALAF